MSIIKIQIHHTSNLSKEYLASLLYDEIGEEYGLNEYFFEDYIEIVNVYKIPNETFVSIFTLDFPEIDLRDLEPKDIVKSYLDTLNSLESVINLVKLQDGFLQKIAKEYFDKIFTIEMELRNVLTYILTYDEKPIERGTFKEFGVQLAESYNSNNFAENYENGLYYILFNHYASFGEPKRLKAEQIAEILQDISLSDFEEFKNRLQRRYISELRHTEFLFSIKEKLKPLENMRNSVMHIRNLSDAKIANFDKAVKDFNDNKGIQTLINEFWENENEELKEQTWLALAKEFIIRLITSTSDMTTGQTYYKINDDEIYSDLEEEYTTIDDLKNDLIPYLQDKIAVIELDTETDQFEINISTLIDNLLL